ncbi:MAG TPA: YggS family pyridoxal phosphate-dependent enzyme [Candidatus Obscuribacterales bacterium]
MADNLARIRSNLGNRPVTLIAVTKNATISQIAEAFENGVTEFGENRIQDAFDRRQALPEAIASHVNWHFIGHLQTNKVKKAVGQFTLIHSVDSTRLANEISSEAVKKKVVQPVLIQVKILADDTKSGFTPEEIRKELPAILKLPNLKVEGLMTITPLSDERSVWQKSFNGLRQLRDELQQEHSIELKELSMGMTSDWQDAVECGATMIRLGRAVFGN